MIHYNNFWKLVYKVYPPVLRILEKVGVHKGRQDFHIGSLKEDINISNVFNYLSENGFEDAVLAWKDTGDVLNMRRIDNKIYQYHLRIFNDNEVKGHYEYSSEGNPLGHIFEKHFEASIDFFNSLLANYLK
jgi:hypothetical protein